jgi:hypothetical protein
LHGKGGLQGKYTNHSGKKTRASHLYIGGVSKADIMSVTGYLSQQCVKKYMRSNVDMKKNVCKILDPPSTNPMQGPSSESSSTMPKSLEPRKCPAPPENFKENHTNAKIFAQKISTFCGIYQMQLQFLTTASFRFRSDRNKQMNIQCAKLWFFL